MRIAILSATTGWHTDELCAALLARGHESSVVPYEGLVASMGHARGRPSTLVSTQTSFLDADAVLSRIIPHGSLEQIIYRVNALHWIEARGIPDLAIGAVPGNTGALRFYERRGFRPTRTMVTRFAARRSGGE